MLSIFQRKRKDPLTVATADTSSHQESPWTRANNAFNDRTLRQGAQIANWRKATFLMACIALTSVCGLIYVAQQPKFVPMPILVDKLGQTLAVKALYGDEAITDKNRLVYREMFDLITNLRSVTTDRVANNDRLTLGFSRLEGAAAKYVREELRKAPPNIVGATKTVQVKVRSAMPLTGKSWQIDWEEHSFNLAGEAIGVESWRSTLQYDLKPTGDEKVIRTNPIGFKAMEMSWQKIAE